MPPRRPGGKYRGVVKRFKAEATLAQEADEARARALQRYLREQEEKKLALLNLDTGKDKLGDASKVKVINMMLDGRRGNVRKFFWAWLEGMKVVKHEKMIRERDAAWRRTCGCLENFCICGAHQLLQDPVFKMPFDVRKERQEKATMAKRAEMALKSLPPLLRTNADRNMDLTSPSKETTLRGSQSMSALTLKKRDIEITNGKHGSRWDCGCEKCVRGEEKSSPTGTLGGTATLRLRPDFMDLEKAEVAIHVKTGRRVLLDPSTMRSCFADVTKPCSLQLDKSAATLKLSSLEVTRPCALDSFATARSQNPLAEFHRPSALNLGTVI